MKQRTLGSRSSLSVMDGNYQRPPAKAWLEKINSAAKDITFRLNRKTKKKGISFAVNGVVSCPVCSDGYEEVTGRFRAPCVREEVEYQVHQTSRRGQTRLSAARPEWEMPLNARLGSRDVYTAAAGYEK